MAGPAAPCRVPPTLPQGRHRPWCELEKGSGWAKARLLLSTDPTLSAPVEAYSRRWSIEPLFRDLKMIDGLGAMWQRGRTALLRWLHLVQIARTLLVLLTARAEPHALIRLGGWRPPWSRRRSPHASGISKLSACCLKPVENRDLYAPPVRR
jgi:hypothetical protein